MLINLFYVTAIIYFLLGKSYQFYRSSCRKGALFKVNERDARLGSNITSSKTFQRLSFCAKACLDEATCKSFNYKQQTKACELLSKTKDEVGSERLISGIGWNHFEPVAAKGTPRCISIAGSELCGWTQACDEVCENPGGYKCRNLDNIALSKSTLQSSTCSNGHSHRAVDGNSNTHWISASCTFTCSGGWWRVDFGKTAFVHSVVITNRGDCCGYRLSNFNIRVGNSTQGRGDSNTVCVVNKGVPQGGTSTFLCRPRLNGRYLYVQSNLVYGMTICEAKVYGEFH